jgi:hypothetical protein
MLRAGLAGDHSRNRNSLSPVMQKHLCQTLLFTRLKLTALGALGWWRPSMPLRRSPGEAAFGAIEVAPVTARPLKKGPTNTMSALHPIATAKAKFRKRQCLLYPQKRTCAVQEAMSAKGQKRTWSISSAGFNSRLSWLIHCKPSAGGECP